MPKEQPVRVLRIINRFNIGGPTYNATFLTRFLPEEYETLLIGGLPEEGEADSLHICDKYDVKPVLLDELQRNPSIKADWKAFLKIRKIIKEFKPDIVHTHAAKAGVLGRLAAFSCGIKCTVHTFHGHVFHSYFGKIKTAIFKWIERFVGFFSTQIIAISPEQKQELTAKFKIVSAKKVTVIPLGFDLNLFNENAVQNRFLTREKFSIAEDEVAIAIIGRLTAIKNHTFIINLLNDLQRDTQRKIVFFIVGDGELKEEIKGLVNDLKWEKNIRVVFTSWIKEVNVFVPGMDIVALCSFNEGTPVSLIEAQAANVAVISNDIGGVKDIVSQMHTGLIVSELDTKAYKSALLTLIENDVLRNQMRENGWEFVKEKFHYSRLIKDMDNLYKRLLNNEK